MPDVPLSPQRDDADFDPQVISALQRYDERLLEGTTPEMSAAETVEDFPAAAEAVVDCLQLLQRVWPRIPQAENDATAQPVQLGRFQLQKVLGQGGFGTVYLAHDPQLGRPVALKLPRLHALAHPGLRERFHREARAAAGLDHPHIVPVYEAGEADGVCFIVSAYCPGPSLATWLKESAKRGMPVRQAAHLLIDLADAVAYSHAKGVLHRDIKPGNVLLAPAGREATQTAARTSSVPATNAGSSFVPRLSDFGLAKLMDEAGGALGPEETSASVTLGTPAYMAPEQIKGDEQRNAPTVDVYALGAVLYELLAGHPPFQGAKVADVLEQVRSVEPQPLRQLRREVPRDLDTICLKCLEKSPDRRYRSAAELRDDLRSYLNGEPIVARPPGPVELGLKWVRRKPAAAIVLLMVVLAGIGGLALQAHHAASLQRANDELATTNQKLNASLAEARRLEAEAIARARKLHTRSYLSSLGAASLDLFNGEGGRAREILAESIPAVPTDPDERGIEWDYLWTQANGPTPLRKFSHGGAELKSAAISPDGRIGVTGDDQGTFKVWNLATGDELASRKAHEARITALEFSDDGRFLASGGSFHNVCVWRTDTWQLERQLVAHDGTVQTIDFSSDGEQLVTGGRNARMRIWDWRSTNLVAEALVPADGDPESVVFRTRFAPDGRSVYAASVAGRFYRWDPQTAEVSVAYQAPEGQRLIGSDVSADGSLIIAAGYFGGITFTTPTGRPAIRIPEDATTYSCAISHDNRRAVLGCASGVVRLVDSPPGMKSLELRHWYGHSARIEGIAMTRDGGVALTASDDGTARLWNLDSVSGIGETLFFSQEEDRNRHYDPRVSPDGRWLATLRTAGDGFVIHLIDLRGGFERRTLALHHDWTAHDTFLHSLQFSRNGDKLYAVTGREQPDRGICAWNLDPGTEPLSEPVNDVCAYRLLPDGVHAVVAHGLGSDRQISIWNLESDQIERTLVGGLPHVHQIQLMADRSSVVVSSVSEYPRLIDLGTGKQRILDSTFADNLNNAVPHPVEDRLVLIRESGSAEWFDPSTMDQSDFAVAVEALAATAFSPNGRLVASSARPDSGLDSQENRVALIDAASNHKLYALPTFGMSVDGMAWLPDGISLVGAFGAALPGDPIMIVWHLSDPDAPHVRVPAVNPSPSTPE